RRTDQMPDCSSGRTLRLTSGQSRKLACTEIQPNNSSSLLELFQDRWIFQGGHVLRDFLALGERAQQAAHDLAGAGLGQVVAETDVLGLGNRADFLGHP